MVKANKLSKTGHSSHLLKTTKGDKLVKIRMIDLPCLCDLYISQKSKSTTFNTLQNFFRWKMANPKMDCVKIYALNGDWSDGTFVIVFDDYSVIFDSLATGANNDRLLKALSLLNYSRLRLLNGYDSRHQPTVDKLLEQQGLDGINKLNKRLNLFVLPNDEVIGVAKSFLARSFVMKPLYEEHAELVDRTWAHRYPRSLESVTKLIRYGKSLGIFTCDGQLVAWIVVHQMGTMDFLKVHHNYKMIGLADILIKEMAKQIAAEGQDVMTLISPNNPESETLFQELGFKKVDELSLCWTFVERKPFEI